VQAPFAAPDESEPEPDVAVVAPGTYLDGHPRGAFLIVEVAETSLARDRLKARLYAAAGVAEYWIVNLSEQVLEVHRQPGAEGYAAVSRHGRGEKLRLAAFEDVALGVDEVLPPARRP
jgi:Uma2 family endonuclease